MRYTPKPLFIERMQKLLPDKKDEEAYWKILESEPLPSIRCNTLKISPADLKQKLEAKGWKLIQPFKQHNEIFQITSRLNPGELGKSIEHLLGYYYVQEISSMMPPLAMNPDKNDIILDIAAAPGSKTSQISALMSNSGMIIANDKSIDRISILSANLERVGASNVIITRHDGIQLASRLKKINFSFDKILCDVPCSGEGTIRTSPKTFLIWNINMINKLSRLQKALASSAFSLLKENGRMIYSTCTHAPEENEEVIDFLVNKFNAKVEPINLPLKTRPGILEWQGKKFNKQIKNCARIYPQDNNTEGFFIARVRK